MLTFSNVTFSNSVNDVLNFISIQFSYFLVSIVSNSGSNSSDDDKRKSLHDNKPKDRKSSKDSDSSDDSKSKDSNDDNYNSTRKNYIKNNTKSSKNNDNSSDSDSSINEGTNVVPPQNSASDELQRIKQELLDTKESQQKSFEEQQKRFQELQEQVKDAIDEQTKRQEELKKQYEEMLQNKDKLDEDGKCINDKELEEARRMLDEKQEDIVNDFKRHKELLERLLQQQQANLEGKETGKHSDRDKKTGCKEKKSRRKKHSSKGISNEVYGSIS